MNPKLFIKSEEEFDELNICSGRYRPMQYLSKYHFSIEALLDIFCSDSEVGCYEDYYYNDFSLYMVEETQPHIDIPSFKELWADLDEIRTAELVSQVAIELFEKNVSNRYIRKWPNELIANFVDKINGLERDLVYPTFLSDYKNLIATNKFVEYYNLALNPELDSPETIVTQAKKILNAIPNPYSSALPLTRKTI
jgi:hypothetical protein